MIFHVVNLPHTEMLKDEYSWCAFTSKARKFANMMHDLGHEVIVYGGERNDARCTEHVTCITRDEQPDGVPPFDANSPLFQKFNLTALHQIKKRIQPRDFICIIGGSVQKVVADAFPNNMTVEYGIGYGGVFAKYKVFESYAWMHTVYGAMSGGNSHGIDGQFFDDVIPNYFEVEDFPFEPVKDDYLLFVGRLIERKGYKLAIEIAKATNNKLVIAGAYQSDTELPTNDPNIEYVGVVGPKERAKLMGKAKALLAPTQYIEPFGGVAVEAMLCGTPVISTDWGAFTETIESRTGIRCRTFDQFCDAVDAVTGLQPWQVSLTAQKYTTERIKYRYQEYFERLETLWQDGFYQR